MKIIISEAQSDVILQPSLVQTQDLGKETCVVIGRVNITMSTFVIGEITNNKLYTAQNSCLNRQKQKTYLQAVSQKRQTVLAKLELPPLIENSLCADSIVGYSSRLRKQSSVKCAAHTLIFGLHCSGIVF